MTMSLSLSLSLFHALMLVLVRLSCWPNLAGQIARRARWSLRASCCGLCSAKKAARGVTAARRLNACGRICQNRRGQTGRQPEQTGQSRSADATARFAKGLQSPPRCIGILEAFPRSSKCAILEWIGNGKTLATRAKRVGVVRRGPWRRGMLGLISGFRSHN